jgi:hypothetical protein
MNLKLEMLAKKLQMSTYSSVTPQHKLSWFKKWNELSVLRDTKKFPKQGFLDE